MACKVELGLVFETGLQLGSGMRLGLNIVLVGCQELTAHGIRRPDLSIIHNMLELNG